MNSLSYYPNHHSSNSANMKRRQFSTQNSFCNPKRANITSSNVNLTSRLEKKSLRENTPPIVGAKVVRKLNFNFSRQPIHRANDRTVKKRCSIQDVNESNRSIRGIIKMNETRHQSPNSLPVPLMNIPVETSPPSKLTEPILIQHAAKLDITKIVELIELIKQPKQAAKVESQLPDLTSLESDLLKVKYNEAIQRLHIGKQCDSCGKRFTSQSENGKSYADHLDWHFSQNMRAPFKRNKANSRNWFNSFEEWASASHNKTDLNKKSGVVEKEKANNIYPIRSCSNKNSIGDDIENKCAMCNESFETFWNDEADEWHYRNAVYDSNKLFHPGCFQDFIKHE